MASSVIIQHPVNGLTRKGYFGFSWTYLFFGWWVPLIRGELGIAALHFLFTALTLGLWQLIVAFLYNKQYMTRMLEKGYVLKDSESTMARAKMALGIAEIP
ncbi:MAG: hypothetical protein K2X98_01735 [Alphaproteobacteria bacterium]|nr:hypothetical protein [Alphaproteobacteria bacterium]